MRLKTICTVTMTRATVPAAWTSPKPTVAIVVTEKYSESVLVSMPANEAGSAASVMAYNRRETENQDVRVVSSSWMR